MTTTAETMQAAMLDTPGAAFRMAQIPRPHPQPGQVLVRVEASAVNPLDIKIRAGHCLPFSASILRALSRPSAKA